MLSHEEGVRKLSGSWKLVPGEWDIAVTDLTRVVLGRIVKNFGTLH